MLRKSVFLLKIIHLIINLTSLFKNKNQGWLLQIISLGKPKHHNRA